MELPSPTPERVVVVEVDGRVHVDASAALRDRLRGLLNQGYKYLLLNVGELTYVDSILLGAIVEGYAASIRHGGGLKLLHVSQRLRQLLAVTKLDTVIEGFESEDAAIASFPAATAHESTPVSPHARSSGAR